MSVKLRKKNLADGKKGLYLDIYHNGQRHYDFLKLYLVKGTSSRIVAANLQDFAHNFVGTVNAFQCLQPTPVHDVAFPIVMLENK